MPANQPVDAGPQDGEASHFAASLLYAAARLYYEDDATQAEVAEQLGTSRATVSRLLSEAKRQGIVRIEVVPPAEARTGDLADRLARALNITSVYLSAQLPTPTSGRAVVDVMGRVLAPAVARALGEAGLLPGDVLLVSSGRTVYEVAQCELTPLPGVVVAPTVGGNDQPEEWYQTNEITRLVANRIGHEPSPVAGAAGINFWGGSMIVGPQGEVVAQADASTSGALVADLDFARTDYLRRIWPYFRDRRIDAYGGLTARFLK